MKLSHTNQNSKNSKKVVAETVVCFVLMKVLSQFLEDVSPLIQEASSVLTTWRGVAGFKTLCGSVLTKSLGPLVGH